MNDTSANPIFVGFLFILRCLVPIFVLLGVSYLLRRAGLVETEAPEPTDEELDEADLEKSEENQEDPSL
jgi:hypothetical protein